MCRDSKWSYISTYVSAAPKLATLFKNWPANLRLLLATTRVLDLTIDDSNLVETADPAIHLYIQEFLNITGPRSP